MRRTSLAAAALLAAAPSLLWAGSQITIVNADAAGQGMNDPAAATPVGGNPGTTLGQQRLNVVQRSADIWAGFLDSPVEIRIQVRFANLTCTSNSAVLASTNVVQMTSDFSPGAGFPGPEFPSTWYPTALANRRAGRDLIPGNTNTNADDISVRINSNLGQTGCGFDWYYGFDSQHGSKTDLITTLLHEYAHGFGFLTAVNPSTGFELSSQPDIFERKILDTDSGKFWPELTDAGRAASATSGNKLAFAGVFTTATAPGVLSGTPTLRVAAPAAIAGNYLIGVASFGPKLTEGGLSGTLVAALDAADATGPTMFDACTALTNTSEVSGKVALVDRGTCTFVSKTLNAQAGGAIAVVVADNVDGSPPPGLGGDDPTITIPAVRITKADGATLRASLSAGVTVKLWLDPSRRAGTDGADHVLLYAPNTVESGSSVSHWDTTAFPNLLMEPNVNDDLTHGVDLTLAAFRDIGWYADIPARGTLAPVHRPHAAQALTPRQ
ncbi:MAG: PA domain-containing protein [Thermoanaerobaculia bacterium]